MALKYTTNYSGQRNLGPGDRNTNFSLFGGQGGQGIPTIKFRIKPTSPQRGKVKPVGLKMNQKGKSKVGQIVSRLVSQNKLKLSKVKKTNGGFYK